jgi:hypothetical protein
MLKSHAFICQTIKFRQRKLQKLRARSNSRTLKSMNKEYLL